MSSRPRVALVAHKVHDEGGMERALAELIRLAHDRIDFEVVAIQLQEDLHDLVRWRRIRTPLRPVPALFSVFYVLGAAALRAATAELVHTMGAIVPQRVDVASVQFCHAAFQSAAAPPGATKPAAVRRANHALDRRVALSAERRTYQPARVRMLVPASSGVQRELSRFYPSVPSSVIPNGADLDRFRPDADARLEERRALGLRPEAVVAAFVGGDWQRKGLEVAVNAVADARKRGASTLELMVVGTGDERRFRGLAAEAGIEEYVRFHGRQRQPERFLAAADVFVFPTAYEAFPLVALEAAASGLPLVATRVNGIEDLVRDGREGFLVDRTRAEVAAALGTLAADPLLRRAMGVAARRRAQDFSWRRATDATLDLYAELLGRPV